jgi:hypothetical protein
MAELTVLPSYPPNFLELCLSSPRFPAAARASASACTRGGNAGGNQRQLPEERDAAALRPPLGLSVRAGSAPRFESRVLEIVVRHGARPNEAVH